MGGLFGSAATKALAQAPSIASGVQIQSSAYGKVIPIVIGTTRLAGNLIWYGDFDAIAHQNPTQSGGKGGVTGGGGKGGGSRTVSYTYTVAFMMGMCEGPANFTGVVWQSQTETSLAALGMTTASGQYGQPPWGYLSANHPSQADPYSGIAWIAAGPFDLGSSANLPNLSAEVRGSLAGTAPNGVDADPSQAVTQLLTNPNWGVGFPEARVGDVITTSEAHSVPASPFQITIAQTNGFLQHLSVVFESDGSLLTCKPLGAALAHGQYTVNLQTGQYTFASADLGAVVVVNYAYRTAYTKYKNFCLASGLWISPAYQTQSPTAQLLDDIAKFTYSEFFFSAGVLQLAPRGSVNVSAHGYNYVAPSEPVTILDINDLVPNQGGGAGNSASNTDPVILVRLRASDQNNDIIVQCSDRNNQYAPSAAEATDQALIDQFKRRQIVHNADMFCDIGSANVSAILLLQKENIRNTYTFTTDQRFAWVSCMDLLGIPYPYNSTTIVTVLVTDMTENDDGTITFTAEEWPVGLGSVGAFTLNAGDGFIPNLNVDPGPTGAPEVFAAPPALARNQGLSAWIAVYGSDVNWGGCDVHVSSDGSTFSPAGRKWAPDRIGVLTADFPSGADPDQTNSLHVDLTQSNGVLVSASQTDADEENTLVLVRGPAADGSQDEWIAYSTATLVAPNQYTLSGYIRRGLNSTVIGDHPLGSKFIRVNPVYIFELPYTADKIGKTGFLKFTSFNIYGGGEESISDVMAHQITYPAPPTPPQVTGFVCLQSGNTVEFLWNQVTYPLIALAGYFIGYAPKGETDWSKFRIIQEAGSGTSMANADIPRGSWTFAIRAVNIAGGLSRTLSTFDLDVTSTQPDIYDHDEASAWLGAIGAN